MFAACPPHLRDCRTQGQLIQHCPVPVPRVVRNNNTTQSSNEGKQLSWVLVLVGGTGALQRETGPVRTPRTAAGGGVFTQGCELLSEARLGGWQRFDEL